MSTKRGPSRSGRVGWLRDIDAGAGLIAGVIVKFALGAVGLLVATYIAAWMLNILSFGSRLEDYDIHPNISPEAPAQCRDKSTRYKQLGGREFYVLPEEGC